MNIEQLTFQPIVGRPTDVELKEVEPLPDVQVLMTTYIDNRSGRPVWLLERFLDPASGSFREVWSRVTDALAYVRG